MRDMPEDAESAGTLVDVLYIFMIPSLSRKNYLDLVLEQLVGIEMLKILRLDGDVDMNRRLLVGKWLYIRGPVYLLFDCNLSAYSIIILHQVLLTTFSHIKRFLFLVTFGTKTMTNAR